MRKPILLLSAVIVAGACAIIFPRLSDPLPKHPHISNTQIGSGIKESEEGHDKMQLDMIIEAHENDPEFLQMVGNIYFDKEKYQNAIRMYSRVLELTAENADVMTDMGIAYRRIGNFQKAVEYFRKAANEDPMHALSRLNLGVVLENDVGDLKAAIEAYNEFLAVAVDHPNWEMALKRVDFLKKKIIED